MAIKFSREPIEYGVERYTDDDAPNNDRQKWLKQNQRPVSEKSKADYSNYKNHQFFVRRAKLLRSIILVHCCAPLPLQGSLSVLRFLLLHKPTVTLAARFALQSVLDVQHVSPLCALSGANLGCASLPILRWPPISPNCYRVSAGVSDCCTSKFFFRFARAGLFVTAPLKRCRILLTIGSP